jgi:hypothetical protein
MDELGRPPGDTLRTPRAGRQFCDETQRREAAIDRHLLCGPRLPGGRRILDLFDHETDASECAALLAAGEEQSLCREALAGWLGEAPAPTRIESEMLVKMLFAPYGSKEDLIGSLRAFRKGVRTKEDELLAIFRQYIADEEPYPDRVHVNVLMFKSIWDYARTESLWAEWALGIAEGWADVAGPREREELIAVLKKTVQEADEQR